MCLLSVPNLHSNIMTSAVSFVKWGMSQVIHGSFMTEFYLKVNSTVGKEFRLAIISSQWSSFRIYKADDMLERQDATRLAKHAKLFGKRYDLPELEVRQKRRGETTFHAAGWKIVIERRRVRWALLDGCEFDWEDRLTYKACKAPKDHPFTYYFDFQIKPLRGAKAKKFGDPNVGSISPHGLMGQTFDGAKLSVSGRLDKYGKQHEVFTKAQAEGAIEGTFADYLVAAPFATDFKYTRYNTAKPIAPRSSGVLTGAVAIVEK